jgi:hypothetical protein
MSREVTDVRKYDDMAGALAPPNPDPSGTGPVRRWLISWKRMEETIAQMAYGPFDHVADRLRVLESRVVTLEGGPQRTKRE